MIAFAKKVKRWVYFNVVQKQEEGAGVS